MTNNYVAWVHKIEPKACSLYRFIGFDKSYLLQEGKELGEQYPKDAYIDMNPDRQCL